MGTDAVKSVLDSGKLDGSCCSKKPQAEQEACKTTILPHVARIKQGIIDKCGAETIVSPWECALLKAKPATDACANLLFSPGSDCTTQCTDAVKSVLNSGKLDGS